ncbi:polymer-forming cytoskeletal protein [Dryocola clanedunensis]|uniref:polymer-forming cytoskeletal protein n=1 Tax=Cedecea sulfonylureivorans TaxID=3051154 RepID=UPI00192541DB
MIASESVFTGSLEIDGDIHIYGKLTGTVMLKDGILHVMRNGFIEGDFTAPNIIINGRVLGTCISEKIEILEHGEMEGIIRTSALSIRPGGSFIGSSERMQIQNKAPEPERVVKIDKKQNEKTAEDAAVLSLAQGE